ncbi:MAG: hypothetical protein AAGF95_31745 [Chloroflexota bacterium]
MQKWAVGLVSVAVMMLVVGCGVLVFWWLPPTEVEMHNHYTRWEQATEIGDWETVWGMLSQPMPYGRPEERQHSPLPDLATFARERQRYGEGLQREVERTMFESLNHNDDDYTYAIGVTITYRDPESQEIVKTQDVRFLLTQRQWRVGTWAFSTNEW